MSISVIHNAVVLILPLKISSALLLIATDGPDAQTDVADGDAAPQSTFSPVAWHNISSNNIHGLQMI